MIKMTISSCSFINFHAPCWFWIMSHPHCQDGPKNLLKMIKFSRKLTLQEQKIAHKTIQQNGFYAHPESILRFILADEDQTLREKAVEIIRSIRKDTAERLREAEERGKQDEEEEEKEGEEEEEEEA